MSDHISGMGRRQWLKLMGVGGAGLAATSTSFSYAAAAQAATRNLKLLDTKRNIAEPQAIAEITPDAALERLMAGNQRFTRQKRTYPHQGLKDLTTVATAQHPFVTLLSCADSRVPGEIVFDQGVGDVFDVRVAGNVVTPEVLGSVEYAAVLLKTPLIMVLGHERCGAVTAAVEGEALPGQIGAFVKAIQPALATIQYDSDDLAQRINQAVTVNVKYQIEELKRNSSLLAQLVSDQKLKIVGGRYDLDTGSVTLIG